MKDKCILRKSNEVSIQALILQAKYPKLYGIKITYKVALSNVRFRKSLNNKDSVAGYNEEIEDRNCKYKDTSMESNNLKKLF